MPIPGCRVVLLVFSFFVDSYLVFLFIFFLSHKCHRGRRCFYTDFITLCRILTTAKLSSISVSVVVVVRFVPTTFASISPVFCKRSCCCAPPSVTFCRASIVRAISLTCAKVSIIARVVCVALLPLSMVASI